MAAYYLGKENAHLIAYRIFNSKDGKALLEMLKDFYLTSPVASPRREPSHAYFREGQNDVIRDFMHVALTPLTNPSTEK